MEMLLFVVGGKLYTLIEILWRGFSHWTMFCLGGGCFVIMGLLNEYRFSWKDALLKQATVSAGIITATEFITGCIVNVWCGWAVWDYSELPFNLLGQICLYYSLLWIPLSMLGIVLDDWLRYGMYLLLHKRYPKIKQREKPHYRLF